MNDQPRGLFLFFGNSHGNIGTLWQCGAKGSHLIGWKRKFFYQPAGDVNHLKCTTNITFIVHKDCFLRVEYHKRRITLTEQNFIRRAVGVGNDFKAFNDRVSG